MHWVKGEVQSITDLGDLYEIKVDTETIFVSKDFFRSIRHLFKKPAPTVNEFISALVTSNGTVTRIDRVI